MRSPLLFLLIGVVQLPAAELSSILTPLAELRAADAATLAIKAAEREKKPTPLREEKADPIRVTGADIVPEIERQLARHYGMDGELKLALLQTWRGALVDDAAWTVELTRLPSQGLSPRLVAPIRISWGEGKSSEHQIVLQARLMREVLVPRRQINRGEPLSSDDFEAQVRDVLESPVPMVPAGEALADFELKTSISPSQPLLWRDIEQKPLVKKGQVLEVIAAEGFMRISIKGQALENGRLGDYISVRNLATRKDLQARILNEQTVQVVF